MDNMPLDEKKIIYISRGAFEKMGGVPGGEDALPSRGFPGLAIGMFAIVPDDIVSGTDVFVVPSDPDPDYNGRAMEYILNELNPFKGGGVGENEGD